jgi:hypothetical protein
MPAYETVTRRPIDWLLQKADNRGVILKVPLSRHSGTRVTLSESMLRQLNLYALGATAAGVGVLAFAQPLEAKIVYTKADVVVYSIGLSHHSKTPLDLNHDGKTDFEFVTTNTTNGTNSWGRISMKPTGRNGVEGTGNVYRLAKGKTIGPAHKFSGGLIEACHWDDGSGSYCHGNWDGILNGYVGLKFLIHGKVHYGWVRLKVNVETTGFQLNIVTLTGYAYETIPNKPIIAGQTRGTQEMSSVGVPKPESFYRNTVQSATLGLLATGAPGLSIWRRGERVASRTMNGPF